MQAKVQFFNLSQTLSHILSCRLSHFLSHFLALSQLSPPSFSPNLSPNKIFSCTSLPIQSNNYWPVTRFNRFQGSCSQLQNMQEVVFGPVVSLQCMADTYSKQARVEDRQGMRVNINGGSLSPRIKKAYLELYSQPFSIHQKHFF